MADLAGGSAKPGVEPVAICPRRPCRSRAPPPQCRSRARASARRRRAELPGAGGAAHGVASARMPPQEARWPAVRRRGRNPCRGAGGRGTRRASPRRPDAAATSRGAVIGERGVDGAPAAATSRAKLPIQDAETRSNSAAAVTRSTPPSPRAARRLREIGLDEAHRDVDAALPQVKLGARLARVGPRREPLARRAKQRRVVVDEAPGLAARQRGGKRAQVRAGAAAEVDDAACRGRRRRAQSRNEGAGCARGGRRARAGPARRR